MGLYLKDNINGIYRRNDEGMIYMIQNMEKLKQLSSHFIHLYIEERDYEHLHTYLSADISWYGMRQHACCLTLPDVQRLFHEETKLYKKRFLIQEEAYEVVCQKPSFAVVTISCTLYSQGESRDSTKHYLRISLIWTLEAEDWKICHVHISAPWKEETPKLTQGCDNGPQTMTQLHNRQCDALTHIYNLEGFAEAVQSVLENTKQQFALFKFGIRDFRFINQTHGYAFGDDVLKCIARNLSSICQKEELCARIEKDTFAVLFHFTNKKELHNRLHNIRKHLLDEHIEKRLKHPIQYIGGVYLIQAGHTESIKSMLDKAVLAMQYVERSSRNSDFLYFEDWMLNQKNRSSELLEEAVKAMQEDAFQLYIQPQFNLIDKNVISGEALSRWFLADGTAVPPDEFITLFEKHGIISSFDFYVLEKLCKVLRSWLDEGRSMLPISINQSRLHIKEPSYLKKFCEIVDFYKIPHELIVYELTESAFTDCVRELQDFMKEIHKAGFQIAIDDFGTGYAGIGMLSQVDADILKLDKSMLNGLGTDRRQMTISWKIIEMAHSIGMQVICEGIETREQYYDLKMLRCDIGQGFLVSRPIPAEQFAVQYLPNAVLL